MKFNFSWMNIFRKSLEFPVNKISFTALLKQILLIFYAEYI